MGSVKKCRRAAVLPLVALLLPVLMVLAAMVINIAYIELVQTELKISTDMATRAAGRVYTLTGDQTAARAKAVELGALNLVAGEPLAFNSKDIEFGKSIRPDVNSRYQFTPNPNDANAVKVVGDLSQGSANGPLAMYLPAFLSQNTVELTESSISTVATADIIVVIDRSGSMAYAVDEIAAYPPGPAAAPPDWFFCDPCPPRARWLSAVSAVGAFLAEVEASPLDEQVGLVTYATDATNEVAISTDTTLPLVTLQQYTDSMCGGGTNISGGLLVANNSFASSSREFATKVILLMTDGVVTVGSNPVAMATTLGEDEIIIFTVTFSDEADQATMQAVAEAAHGLHFHANTGEELEEAFREIGRNLSNILTK